VEEDERTPVLLRQLVELGVEQFPKLVVTGGSRIG
jgi:hypothetical protein